MLHFFHVFAFDFDSAHIVLSSRFTFLTFHVLHVSLFSLCIFLRAAWIELGVRWLHLDERAGKDLCELMERTAAYAHSLAMARAIGLESLPEDARGQACWVPVKDIGEGHLVRLGVVCDEAIIGLAQELHLEWQTSSSE